MNTPKTTQEHRLVKFISTLSPWNLERGEEALKEYLQSQQQSLLDRVNLEVIGEDVPIFVDDKQVKSGDPMLIDLSGGTEDKKFRESCINIEKNGKNLAKADARKKLKELKETL